MLKKRDQCVKLIDKKPKTGGCVDYNLKIMHNSRDARYIIMRVEKTGCK